MKRISVPGLIDLLRVDDAAAIEGLAADPRFDRRYERRGPLINRIVFGRIREVLQLDGRPLPPIAPRGGARPTAAQAALETRLDALIAAGPDLGIGAAIEPLVAWVRGEGSSGDAGPIAQQAIGTLFQPAYMGDRDSWSAAKILGSAPSNLNPFRLLLWGLTRRVERARALLAQKVEGDPSGLHATGVAIHNVVSGLGEMRRIHATPGMRDRLSVAAVVARCIIPPTQVVRQPTKAGVARAGKFTANTLVLLRLEKANALAPGYDTAFMEGSWSACPARRWVPALFASVWRKAIAGTRP